MAVESKVDVAIGRDAIVNASVYRRDTPFGQGLGPKAVFAGQVRAGVLGKRSAKTYRVVCRETDTQYPIPLKKEGRRIRKKEYKI